MAGDLRLRRRILPVVGLGLRPVLELIEALLRLHLSRRKAEALVESFAAVDPAHLVVTGGDKLPPPIIREVAG